jgi:nitroreductase
MSKLADTDKPLLEAIAKRWSPRAFAEREPTDAELELVFEAARWAASCFNDQPWRYIVVRRAEPEFADALAGLVESNQVWAREAPVLGFSLAQANFTQTGKPNLHAWHDVGAASAQLSIQAATIGLLVHQMAGINRDVVRERFAVPESLEVVAGFAIGWPGDPQQLAEPLRERELAQRSRRALSDTLIRGRFGASQ